MLLSNTLKGGINKTRALLQGLLQILESVDDGQSRLNQITDRITSILNTDVCSIYLLRSADTLELCASKGLNESAVHVTRMRLGEGLVGRVAKDLQTINTADAPNEAGFRYMPETGEEKFASFLGIPVLQRGKPLGVLVVQTKETRKFSEDEIQILKIVATALADMTELGKFVSDRYAIAAPHTRSAVFHGSVGQEGMASGHVLLHEPRVVVTNPIADNPQNELKKLNQAIKTLRGQVDEMAEAAMINAKDEQREVVETYRMFANSKGWVERIKANIRSGLSAEASVEKEQSDTRTKMEMAAPYLRDRLSDLDDLSNRLLRTLTGQGQIDRKDIPENPVLVARQIGPGELIEYGSNLKAVVLEEGAIAAHATIIARTNSIPLLVHVKGILSEALNGDTILVDGEAGSVYLRPEEDITAVISNKIDIQRQQLQSYQKLRKLPATSKDGISVSLHMNAGLLSQLPNFKFSGAEGVGLFRTELRFLSANRMPRREELADQYSLVLDSASNNEVCFRTLDIGSDKLLPYLSPNEEPNPALGWRAIRIGLDRKNVLKMQLQALIRGAKGRPLSVMFPLVAEAEEYYQARQIFQNVLESEKARNRPLPENLKVGAMLETPSLAFAPDQFFKEVDFISIGGNDLQQYFFAADRQNERVRSRYGTLNTSYLSFIQYVVDRCAKYSTPLSYCGESAGRPIEAVCLAAIGLRKLSMRSASIGKVKNQIRNTNFSKIREIIDAAHANSQTNVRSVVEEEFKLISQQVRGN